MRPKAGGLWLCPDDRDPVAEGATIYGKRILEGVPAYLDTMPQISILAQEEIGRATWYPLLKAEEVPGGKEHTDRIKKRFQLSSGKRHLHVYLYKGSVDEAPSPSQDCLDSSSVRSERVSFCKARVVREVVRRLGSLEAVQRRASFYFQSQEACYAHRFAEALFAKPGREQFVTPESTTSESARTLLRRAVFDFPSAPENDTLLDIEVRIRPASGLARIEIIPEDSSFLKRDRVMLNYSTMRPASKLPVRMRGWPPIEEIVVDPSDDVLVAGKDLVEALENTTPIDPEYISLADRIRDEVLKRSTLKTIGDFYLYLRAIDQEGCACTASGEEILSRIAKKFENDFSTLLSKRCTTLLNKIFTRAAWLYARTPPNIVAYITGILKVGFSIKGWNWAVGAAGRAVGNVEDFRLLFKSIAHRAQSGPADQTSFPNQAARSICHVLMLRKHADQGLDRETAQLFADRALKRLLAEEEAKNFRMLYFHMVRLLLYLLRYRRTDPSCFDPTVPESIRVFEEAKRSMGVARDHFPGGSTKAAQIRIIIDGFDKYLHYEGTEDILPVLREMAEMKDGNTV